MGLLKQIPFLNFSRKPRETKTVSNSSEKTGLVKISGTPALTILSDDYGAEERIQKGIKRDHMLEFSYPGFDDRYMGMRVGKKPSTFGGSINKGEATKLLRHGMAAQEGADEALIQYEENENADNEDGAINNDELNDYIDGILRRKGEAFDMVDDDNARAASFLRFV